MNEDVDKPTSGRCGSTIAIELPGGIEHFFDCPPGWDGSFRVTVRYRHEHDVDDVDDERELLDAPIDDGDAGRGELVDSDGTQDLPGWRWLE